jgi:hypothetical protein
MDETKLKLAFSKLGFLVFVPKLHWKRMLTQPEARGISCILCPAQQDPAPSDHV